MPVYHITLHAYGTWMPDREEGFVRRHEGIQPPDETFDYFYRLRANESAAEFTETIQRMLIEETITAAKYQRWRVHYVATEPTHVHTLASWRDERKVKKLVAGLKSSLTRKLNAAVERRTWLVEGKSAVQVKDDDHFNHLILNYLPGHSGWKWSEHDGWLK